MKFSFTKKAGRLAKRVGCLSLAVILAAVAPLPLSMAGISAVDEVSAASFPDTSGHWAEQYISQAVEKGFVKGYEDGSFKPDAPITRAELVSLFNRILGNTGTASINLSDVPTDEWYYNDVRRGVAAGFVSGYTDGTFKPSNQVTREEVAVMLSRIVPTASSPKQALNIFPDGSAVSDWSSDAVARICGKGYMGAYDDGMVHPQDQLTRAQASKIICDVSNQENIISTDPSVRSDGTVLVSGIYTNNVTIHSDLKNGSATINDSVILGTLNVNGGGSDTVTVADSRVVSANVSRSDDKVRLLAEGETNIVNVVVDKDCTLQSSNVDGGSYGQGMNNVTISDSAVVIMKGSFPVVNVDGASASVTLESGTIKELNVTSSAKNSSFTLGSNAKVDVANVDAASNFYGQGTIDTMYINTNNVKYDKEPNNIKKGSKVDKDDEDDDDSKATSDLGDGVTVTPKKGATKVDLDTKIVFKFDSAMTLYNGKTIKDSDLSDFITVRRKSDSGTKINFDAEISSNKKTITITPDDNLDSDTRYYVIIDKNSMRDADDNGNAKIETYFNTGSSTSKFSTTYSPKNGATGVALRPEITITFSEAVVRYDTKKAVSSSYLDDVITFKTNSSSGSNISYSASIDSKKKVITIKPSSNLDENTKYYVAVNSKSLRTDDGGDAVSASSITFTTQGSSSSSSAVTNISFSNVGSNSFTFKATGNQKGTIYAVVSKSSSAPSVSNIKSPGNNYIWNGNKSVSNTGTAVEFGPVTGLESGVTYYVHAYMEYDSKSSTVRTASVTTEGASSPAVLKNISITNASSFVFNANTATYDGVLVPFDSTSIAVSATPSDSKAQISINGTSGQSSQVDFPRSTDSAQIKVVSQLDLHSATYTINVKRNGDASVDEVRVDGSRTFYSGGTYGASTSNASPKIEVTTTDPNATISWPGGATGNSYTASNLKSGDNEISFTVKSLNNVEKTHKIIIQYN